VFSNQALVKHDARVAISFTLATNSYRILATGALPEQGANLKQSNDPSKDDRKAAHVKKILSKD
jgi:hypothetical protein